MKSIFFDPINLKKQTENHYRNSSNPTRENEELKRKTKKVCSFYHNDIAPSTQVADKQQTKRSVRVMR